MKISEHARQRWLERINPDARDVDNEILEARKQAVEFFREEDANKLIAYALKDNILFIHELKEDVLVTVIDVDFGFSQEINKQICSMQLNRILAAREELSAEEDFVRCETEGIDTDLVLIEEEIKKIKADLEVKEAAKNRLLSHKEALLKDLQVKLRGYLCEVDRIRYSISYRIENIKLKGGFANAKKGTESA